MGVEHVEERSEDEVTYVRLPNGDSVQIVPDGVHARNPSFDTTGAGGRIEVLIGTDSGAPPADLAPRKRSRGPDGAKGGQGKEGQQGQGGESRGKRERGEGDQKGQTGPAPAEPSGAAKSQP